MPSGSRWTAVDPAATDLAAVCPSVVQPRTTVWASVLRRARRGDRNERCRTISDRGDFPRREQPGNPLVAGRSSRIFRLPNGWYFNTREKIALGPFTSAEAATLGIADFLDFLREAPDHAQAVSGRTGAGGLSSVSGQRTAMPRAAR